MLDAIYRTAASLLVGAALATLGITTSLAQVDASNDIGIRGADPSVIHTEDDYVSVESRAGRTLLVRLAPSLEELADAKPKRIWSDRDRLGEVWAPEIVFRDGQYSVYFAAGVGSDHRMYSIHSVQPDAEYGEATEIVLPDGKWAIDGLPFTYRELDYFIWSGWEGDTDVQQNIYIARLGDNDDVDGPRVVIGSPDQAWENIGAETPTINEGPQPIIDPAGQLHITYSANGSWGQNYCLADIRLQIDGDPLDPAAWFESPGCLFGANGATLADAGTLATAAKGVGHHSFVLPEGNAGSAIDPESAGSFLYHGVPTEEEPSNFWAARRWFAGTYQWVPDAPYRNKDAVDTGWGLKFSE